MDLQYLASHTNNLPLEVSHFHSFFVIPLPEFPACNFNITRFVSSFPLDCLILITSGFNGISNIKLLRRMMYVVCRLSSLRHGIHKVTVV